MLLRSKEKRSGESESRRSRSRDTTTKQQGRSSHFYDEADSSAAEELGTNVGGPFSLPSFDDEISSAALRRRRTQRHQLKKSSSLTDFDHQAVISLRDDIAAAAAANVGPRSLSTFQLPVVSALPRLPAELSSSSSSSSRPAGHQASSLLLQVQQQMPPREEESGGGGGGVGNIYRL